MSHDTDTKANANATPDRSERIQRLRQALRHPKILAADGWYTPEDDRIAPTDREYIAACEPATISALLSDLDELWRIVGAYRPQKELADALKKSKSSRVDAVNRLKAEQAKRLTLQHHAADLAQRVADLTAERDALVARLAEIERAEPVAVVGDTYSLLWAQPGTMPEIVRRCGIKVGSLLFALPTTVAAPTQATPADGCGACGDACKSSGCRLAEESPQAELTSCQADRDGDCGHPACPQLRDGEPDATGRDCPLGLEGGAA